jgi:hypothetical protein
MLPGASRDSGSARRPCPPRRADRRSSRACPGRLSAGPPPAAARSSAADDLVHEAADDRLVLICGHLPLPRVLRVHRARTGRYLPATTYRITSPLPRSASSYPSSSSVRDHRAASSAEASACALLSQTETARFEPSSPRIPTRSRVPAAASQSLRLRAAVSLPLDRGSHCGASIVRTWDPPSRLRRHTAIRLPVERLTAHDFATRPSRVLAAGRSSSKCGSPLCQGTETTRSCAFASDPRSRGSVSAPPRRPCSRARVCPPLR